MNKFFNIEEQLQSRLEGFKTEPSPALWEKICSELDSNSKKGAIGGFKNMASIFEEYTVTPSAGVWRKIAAILGAGTTISFLARMLSSQAFRYSVGIFLTFVAIFTASYLPTTRNYKTSKEQTTKIVPQKTDSKQDNITQNLNKKGDKTIVKSKQPVQSIKKTEQTVKTNKTLPIASQNQAEKNTKLLPVDQKDAKINIGDTQGTKILSQVDPVVKNITPHKTVTPKSDSFDEKIKTNIPVIPTEFYLPVKRNHAKKFSLQLPKGYNLEANTLDPEAIDEFYSIRDTFFLNWYNKFNGKKIYDWYAGINFMPKYATSIVITDDALYQYPLERFKEVETPNPGYKVGLNIGHVSLKNYLIETGLNYEFRRTYAFYNMIYTRTDTSFLIGHDSIGFIFNVIDSTYTTIYQNHTDTSISRKGYKFLAKTDNTHKIVEIPIVFGYRVSFKKSTFLVKSGFIAGFPVGKTVKVNTIDGIYLDEIPYPLLNKVHWSMLFMFEYNYCFFDRVNLMIAPAFRYPLNSIYKDYPIQKKFYSWGLNMGLYYSFGLRTTY